MTFKFRKIILCSVLFYCCSKNSFASCLFDPLFANKAVSILPSAFNGNRCEVDELKTPNAFSPNGDSFNDMFCLEGWETCVTEFEIFIFNRWGEIVFESIKPDFCWDGTYKGKILESNIYVFVIKAKTKEGIEFKKSGNLTLIR